MSLLHTADADAKNQTPVGASNPLPVSSDMPGAWSYAAAAGGIINTTDVAIKAAGGAGVVTYLTSIDITNQHATVSTEVVVKDGSTVIWRSHFQAVNVGGRSFRFPVPLRSTANTALNVACITTGAAVYVNAQGYAK